MNYSYNDIPKKLVSYLFVSYLFTSNPKNVGNAYKSNE